MVNTLMKAVALLCLLLSPHAGRAETAGEVMDHCRQFVSNTEDKGDGKFMMKENYRSGFCWGTFAGVQGLLSVTFVGQNAPAFNICIEHVSRMDLIWTFLEYTRKHPGTRKDDFIPVTLKALGEAYGCK